MLFIHADNDTFGPISPQKCILLVSSTSQFKNLLILNLKKVLSIENYNIETIPLTHLKKINAAEYDLIVIINSIWAGKTNRHVTAFLKKNLHHHKIILVNTAGDKNFKYQKHPEVSSITSASKNVDVSDLTKEVLIKIKTILVKEE
jgi:hypothetical protein